MIKKETIYTAKCDGCGAKYYGEFSTYKKLERSLKQSGWKKYRKDKKIHLACDRCVNPKKQNHWSDLYWSGYRNNNSFFNQDLINKLHDQQIKITQAELERYVKTFNLKVDKDGNFTEQYNYIMPNWYKP